MTHEEFLNAWASLGISPNAEQLAIMDHGDGPLQITVGLGVGKTYALALRVCFLLYVQEVPPEAIVLTTFTRKKEEQYWRSTSLIYNSCTASQEPESN